MKYIITIDQSNKQGYVLKYLIQNVEIEAETAKAALQKVLDTWDLSAAPGKVEEVFEDTVDKFSGMTGNYSYNAIALESLE